METFFDRLHYVVDQKAKRTRKGKPQYIAFGEACGIPKGTFADYYKNKNKIPIVEHLVRISEHSGFSMYWLATGKGPMRGSEPCETHLLDSIREQFQSLTDDSKDVIVGLFGELITIFALGNESTKIAITNNVHEFHRTTLVDRGVIPPGADETDRASPSTPDKPQKTILGGTGGK